MENESALKGGPGSGRHKEGDTVRFDGKSADGKVSGSMDVKIVNAHSNADKVTKTEGKGNRMRQYEGASRHIPTATVENIRNGKQFEAYHHTLQSKKSLTQAIETLREGKSLPADLREEVVASLKGGPGSGRHPEGGSGRVVETLKKLAIKEGFKHTGTSQQGILRTGNDKVEHLFAHPEGHKGSIIHDKETGKIKVIGSIFRDALGSRRAKEGYKNSKSLFTNDGQVLES